MKTLLHNYSKKAGRTLLWDTSDNEEWFKQNMSRPELRQRLQNLGFLDRPITYQFNSHGFRTAEFDRDFDIVCFGCSFTMGTGVHEQDTWPAQLAALTGLQVANLGHAGSSNDTVFRFADHYLGLLKPKYAVWLQTDWHRFELIDETSQVVLNILATDTQNPCANDYFFKHWCTSPINQDINLRKNTLAFEHLCLQLGIKSVILPRQSVPPHPPFPHGEGRDLTHPGASMHKTLALLAQSRLDQSL